MSLRVGARLGPYTRPPRGTATLARPYVDETGIVAWALDPSGNDAGTPGNSSLTLLAGPPTVCRNVDAALREYKVLKRARKYWNTSNVAKARLQPNVWEAASEGSELHWVYSLTGGPPFAESGVFVRADRVNFPEPGDFLALVAGAIGPNVLFTLATKNGDGTLTLKASDVFVETVSSEEPPDSPEGDAPDVPSGGSLGTIILDYNALEESYADNDPVTLASDQSASDNDAAPDGAFSQGNPTFKANGLGTGLPSYRFDGSNDGFTSEAQIGPGPWTLYFVFGNGVGSGSTSSNQQLNACMMSADSGPGGWGISMRADGKIVLMVGSTGFANTNVQTTNAFDDAGPHLGCLVFDRTGAAFSFYVDDMTTAEASHDTGALGTGALDTSFQVRFGENGSQPAWGGDYGRVIAWDAAHNASGRASVKAALQAIWGTP